MTLDLNDGDAVTNTTDVSNIENIYGSRYRDTLTGDTNANTIEGQDDADTLSGGAEGNEPGEGADVNDTLSYSTSDDGVRINLNADANTITEIARSSGGHASGDTITYNTFENIIGSAYDDDLVGSAAANTIEGGDGADDMDGGNGRDGATIGLDATTLADGDYDDTLSYRSSDAGVIVNLTNLSFSGGHATGDNTETFDYDPDGTVGDKDEFEVSSFENLIGSAHDDRLTGDFRDNRLEGGAGDDSLKGAAGMDTLIGGPGADDLDGGKSADEDDPDTPDVDES